MNRNFQTSTLFLIVLIAFINAFLLINDLEANGLWVDEGWSVAATDGDLSQVIDMSAADVHPPLFFIELMLWRQLSGNTIFALRYFTVLINIIGIALIFRLGNSLFNARTGLIAAIIFALHDLVLVLGQEIRQYPQLYVLCALTLWLYWRMWQVQNRHRTTVFIFSGIALIWTHYWGGFVLLALGCHTLLTRPKSLKTFITAYIVIGLSFIPWLYVAYEQITKDVPKGLGHAIPNGADGYRILAYQLLGLPELFWAALFVAGMAGSLEWSRRQKLLPTSKSSLPAIVVMMTVGLSILINAEYASLSFRALSVVVPAIIVLVAHALAQFRTFEQIAVVGFIIVQSLATTSAAAPTRLPWEDVAKYISAHSNTGDAILIETWFDTYALSYYLEQTDPDNIVIASDLERRQNDEQHFQTFLDEVADEYNGIWVIHFASEENIGFELEARGIMNTASRRWETTLANAIDLWRFDRVTNNNPIVVYGDVLRLEKANARIIEDGNVAVNLIWSPLYDLEQNYTISTFLLDQNGFLAGENNDSYPFEGLSPTIDWQTGRAYFDSHILDANGITSGQYSVGVKVYYFVDGAAQQLNIVPVADCEQNCDYAIVDTIEID